jgi:signal transduction histidine kinase
MRFALALSAVFAIGTLTAGGLSYLLLSKEMAARLAADVQSSAESLAQIAAAGDRTDLREQVIAQVRASRDAAALFAFVDVASGETLGSLQIAKPFQGPHRLLVGQDIPKATNTALNPPEAYLAYGIRTDLGWVIAARDEAWVTESGEILIQATASSLGLATLLCIGVALMIARRNERRIDRMDQVLDAVGAGRLDCRIKDSGDDDLADMSARVDRMLDQLEKGVEAVRQVSTDVAHDLRAPLARLRMRLEPQALSLELPDDARHEIGSALQDIDAISATFDAILRLARLESGTATLRLQPVDLCSIARDVHELLEPTAADAGRLLTLDLAVEEAWVLGDEELLSQALVNLVDNALRHCPAPAPISIEVRIETTGPVLVVSDNGPGIPASDRGRVLGRFVRLDASRSVAGSGIGLTLIASIAKLHGATLKLSDNEPGLRASLEFSPPSQMAADR